MKAFEAFSRTKCDKGHVHGYDKYYDEIFENFTPESILEIGVLSGSSLVAWRLMFPECYIHGIDITKKFFNRKVLNLAKAHVNIVDSTKPEIRQKTRDNYDIIIDDGSHYYKDTMKTFKHLHDKFNNYYIIEDYYYDIDMARKYINNFGFYDITFCPSDRSKVSLLDRKVFRSSKKTSSIMNQNMIIIKR